MHLGAPMICNGLCFVVDLHLVVLRPCDIEGVCWFFFNCMFIFCLWCILVCAYDATVRSLLLQMGNVSAKDLPADPITHDHDSVLPGNLFPNIHGLPKLVPYFSSCSYGLRAGTSGNLGQGRASSSIRQDPKIEELKWLGVFTCLGREACN
jgi:hypothetical protein